LITVLITLLENQKNRELIELEALLDSGAGGFFINTTFTKENEFTLCDLPKPLNAYSVDGTLNKKGTIMSYVEADLQIGEWITKTQIYITRLGNKRSF
jgi:hypothetical protein